MAAKKARKTKKAPSAAQIAWRKKFAAKVKAGAFKKAAKKRRALGRKSPAKKAAKKNATQANRWKLTGVDSKGFRYLRIVSTRAEAEAYARRHDLKKVKIEKIQPSGTVAKRNGKTVIKAKRVTILNLTKKKNPPRKANITSASDLAYAGTAKKATQDGVKGWMLGSKFFPGSATTKAQKITASAYLDLRTGDVWKRKAKGNPKKKKNIAGFMQDGVFHPIRSGVEQRTVKGKTRLVKSKKPYKPSKVGEKATYSRKKSAKRAAQSKRMAAATKQRKATTSRLASRSLQRSVPLKGKRRNPRVSIDAAQKYDRALRWFVNGQITEAGLISRAKEYGFPIRLVRADIKAITGKSPERSKKRNPNADTKAAYESFQGKPSTKSTSLNFPNGTPANVYKLGTLHSITLQSGAVVKPAGKAVWLCADTKGRLHLGTSGERLVNAPKGALGKVREVEYITTKPHLGDNKPTRYYHELGEETGQKPTLYSDGQGGLLFKGGATYVRSDGIHN